MPLRKNYFISKVKVACLCECKMALVLTGLVLCLWVKYARINLNIETTASDSKPIYLFSVKEQLGDVNNPRYLHLHPVVHLWWVVDVNSCPVCWFQSSCLHIFAYMFYEFIIRYNIYLLFYIFYCKLTFWFRFVCCDRAPPAAKSNVFIAFFNNVALLQSSFHTRKKKIGK